MRKRDIPGYRRLRCDPIFLFFDASMPLTCTEYTQTGNGHFLAHMMVKSAQPGKVGGARPPPFTLSTITYTDCGVRSS